MFLRTIITVAIAATFLLSGGAAAQDISRKTTAQADWGFQQLIWNGSSNRTEYRYAVFNRDGMLEICGVFSSRGANISRFGREAMRVATLNVNGQRIMKDMRFFKEVSNRAMGAKLVGAQANCVNTLKPFPARGSQFSLEIPQDRFRLN